MTTLKQILDEQAQLESKAGTPTVLFPTEEWEMAYLNGGLSGLVYEKMCAYVGPDHPFHCRLLISDAIKIAMLATHAAQIRTGVQDLADVLSAILNSVVLGDLVVRDSIGKGHIEKARAVLNELGFGETNGEEK